MKSKVRLLYVVIAFCVLVPCAAFALGSLTIDGSAYNSAALTANLSGTGWSWSASANGGLGELILSGYDGSEIAATDGVLNIRLVGENVITSDALNLLQVSGANTGLHITGSDPATDRLIARSTILVTSSGPVVSGIKVTSSTAATIPFSLSSIGYVFDTSQAAATELFPNSGIYNALFFYGINVALLVYAPSIQGIDMEMDNSIFDMSNESTGGNFLYGMWASPYYSAIDAVFNGCTFNIADFSSRGWYTGRDYATESNATYNDCVFNMHTTSTMAIGLHVSADNELGVGATNLTLNNPSGEIETAGLAALYSRSSTPTLTVNGATMQTWQANDTEIWNPLIVTVFADVSRDSIVAKTVGITDSVYADADYYTMAAHILFTLLPPLPQTGDSQNPALFALLMLLSAAGLLLRGRALRR